MLITFSYPPPSAPRCGRPTKAGNACRSFVMHNEVSCRSHMSPEEVVTAEARREAEALEWANRAWPDPACWSWPVIDELLIEARRINAIADPLDRFDAGRSLLCKFGARTQMEDYSQMHCAICDDHVTDNWEFVLDHDHRTGLMRGYLCRGCNSTEPSCVGEFAKYQQRNPASMLGLAAPYCSLFHGLARPALPPLAIDENHPTFRIAAKLFGPDG